MNAGARWSLVACAAGLTVFGCGKGAGTASTAGTDGSIGGNGGGGASALDSGPEAVASPGSSDAGDAATDPAAMESGDAEPATSCTPAPWTTGWPLSNSSKFPALPNQASYDLSTPGVVVDKVTGLVWQAEIATSGGDSNGIRFSWSAATNYCATLGLLDKHDWRVPSLMEFMSIVDDTGVDPVWANAPVDRYWTSSIWTADAGSAWGVPFVSGSPEVKTLSFPMRVRCVRQDHAELLPHCYSVSNGTVHDSGTKLTWQREVLAATYNWLDALLYCKTLTLDGGGWRLPRVKELMSIMDFAAKSAPPVDPTAFPSTPATDYWTASEVPTLPGAAWMVRFGNGVAQVFTYNGESGLLKVRCVR